MLCCKEYFTQIVFAKIRFLKKIASILFNFLKCTNKQRRILTNRTMVRVTREALLINSLSRIMRVIRSRLMRVKIGSEGGVGEKGGALLLERD